MAKISITSTIRWPVELYQIILKKANENESSINQTVLDLVLEGIKAGNIVKVSTEV